MFDRVCRFLISTDDDFMRYARIIKNGIAADIVTDALDYKKPASHRTADRFVCADACCAAPMYHKNASYADGGIIRTEAHFATFPERAHIEDCQAYAVSAEKKEQDTILQALQKPGKRILLNLDFGGERRLRSEFGAAVNARRRGILDDFKKQDVYIPVAVTDMLGLLRHMNTLRKSGVADALDRTYVNYRGYIQPFASFFIDNDKMRLKNLFNDLCRKKNQALMLDADGVHLGLPHLLSFCPTKREMRGAGWRGRINGNAQRYAAHEKTILMLLQRLKMADDVLKDVIVGQGKTFVLAVPSVDFPTVKKTVDKFRARATGEQAFLHMDWQIVGAYQMQPDLRALPSRKEQQLKLF
jgi:hypothetical protein